MFGRGRATERIVLDPFPSDWKEWEEGLSKGNSASVQFGGYSHASVPALEGRYVCFRPMFATPDIVNAYLVIVGWDAKRSCLTFQEEARTDSAYTL
jgi:hypothetical protein